MDNAEEALPTCPQPQQMQMPMPTAGQSRSGSSAALPFIGHIAHNRKLPTDSPEEATNVVHAASVTPDPIGIAFSR
jgi:hypothetical protein